MMWDNMGWLIGEWSWWKMQLLWPRWTQNTKSTSRRNETKCQGDATMHATTSLIMGKMAVNMVRNWVMVLLLLIGPLLKILWMGTQHHPVWHDKPLLCSWLKSPPPKLLIQMMMAVFNNSKNTFVSYLLHLAWLQVHTYLFHLLFCLCIHCKRWCIPWPNLLPSQCHSSWKGWWMLQGIWSNRPYDTWL